jgi:hypothetical protein
MEKEKVTKEEISIESKNDVTKEEITVDSKDDATKKETYVKPEIEIIEIETESIMCGSQGGDDDDDQGKPHKPPKKW